MITAPATKPIIVPLEFNGETSKVIDTGGRQILASLIGPSFTGASTLYVRPYGLGISTLAQGTINLNKAISWAPNITGIKFNEVEYYTTTPAAGTVYLYIKDE